MTTPKLAGLPSIDPMEAVLRQDVIAALTGRRCAGTTLVARIEPMPDRLGGWLACSNGAAVAIERIDALPDRFDAEDGLAAVALIERAEPLLRCVEISLGIDLDPERITLEPPSDSLIVNVAGMCDGEAHHAIRLALPLTAALLPTPADFAPKLVAGVAVCATLRINGPRLAPHDAAALAPGDCLLLGVGPLTARLSAPPLPDISGEIDLATRRFQGIIA